MISIITAHYNSSEKIDALISSLKRQTSEEFEWIIVDDCSRTEEYITMRKKVECTELNAIVLRNKKNGGPGFARNNGLQKSTGDYITFIDCDDAVSKDFVEVLNRLSKEKRADIIAFDYIRIRGKHKNKCNKIDHAENGEIEIHTFLLQAKTCVCGSIFKRSLIRENNITFPSLYRYEDWVFNVYASVCSSTIWYEKRELYYYIESEHSLVTSGKHDAAEYASKAFILIEDLMKNYNQEVLELLYAREILYVNAISKAKRYSMKEYKYHMKILTEKHPSWRKNSYIKKLPIHQRFILTALSYRLYSLVKLISAVI